MPRCAVAKVRPDVSEDIKLQAMADLGAWQERYAPYRRRLPELAGVFEVLDSLGMGRLLLQPGQHAVYALVDPDSGEIAYVGISAHPEERLLRHGDADAANPAKTRWMERLLLRGLRPWMRYLGVGESKQAAEERERRLIEGLARAGYPLLNLQAMPRDQRRA